MSLDTAIRGALQLAALAVPGFPPQSQVSFEGKSFSSTVGVPWARLRLSPLSSRPTSVNVGTKRHDGIFLIDVFVPPNTGTEPIEALADAIKNAMPAGRRLLAATGDTVGIDYIERTRAMEQQTDLMCSVTVKWHCFSQAN